MVCDGVWQKQMPEAPGVKSTKLKSLRQQKTVHIFAVS